jgi:hypothetical protein
MDEIDVLEPLGLEVFRAHQCRGAAVGHEGALAVGRDQHADASGPVSGDPHGPHRHPVSLELRDERPAGAVPADRAHQLRADAEAGEPARDVRRRAALPDLDATRDVRPALDRGGGHQDDVHHEVAEHEDAGRGRADGIRRGRGGHSADGSDAASASTLP